MWGKLSRSGLLTSVTVLALAVGSLFVNKTLELQSQRIDRLEAISERRGEEMRHFVAKLREIHPDGNKSSFITLKN